MPCTSELHDLFSIAATCSAARGTAAGDILSGGGSPHQITVSTAGSLPKLDFPQCLCPVPGDSRWSQLGPHAQLRDSHVTPGAVNGQVLEWVETTHTLGLWRSLQVKHWIVLQPKENGGRVVRSMGSVILSLPPCPPSPAPPQSFPSFLPLSCVTFGRWATSLVILPGLGPSWNTVLALNWPCLVSAAPSLGGWLGRQGSSLQSLFRGWALSGCEMESLLLTQTSKDGV